MVSRKKCIGHTCYMYLWTSKTINPRQLLRPFFEGQVKKTDGAIDEIQKELESDRAVMVVFTSTLQFHLAQPGIPVATSPTDQVLAPHADQVLAPHAVVA